MTDVVMNGAPDPPPGFTDEQLQQMFNNLLAASQEAQEAWMRRYVPPFLWDHFEHYFEEHVAGDPNTALIANNDPISVVANNGDNLPGTPGRAEVSGGVMVRVRMQAQPLATIVFSGQPVAMQTSAGAALPGSPGTANVAAGVLNYVRLAAAPTSAIVSNGASVTVMDNNLGTQPGSPGTATVSASTLQFVRLGAVDIAEPPP